MARDLALMFLAARFLHVVRDGREVVESMLASGFNMPAARDFSTACEYWRGLVRRGIEAEHSHSERVLRVRHARMAADPAGYMQEVLDFLGAEQSDAPADFLKGNVINSSFGNQPAGQGGQSARSRVERWNATQQQTCDRIAGQQHRELFGE